MNLRRMAIGSCSFFFILRPQPARSTLFPYTTLFRSVRAGMIDKPTAPDERPGERAVQSRAVIHRVVIRRGIDRKSTRLNSSHTVTSYAVFCLKKKSSY